MAQQTMLFTVMPVGMQLNPAALRVSVNISPRLEGSTTLGDYPDWLNWTGRLQETGLTLTFRCGGETLDREIDTGVLRPDLWRAMFHEDTFVRTHVFKDYTDRAIMSFSVRLALSSLKSVYQQAGAVLGIPDRSPQDEQERRSLYRLYLKNLLSGLDVHWNEEKGDRLRKTYRASFAQLGASFSEGLPAYPAALLDADGTIKNMPPAGSTAAKNLNSFLSDQFALYSHMPAGALLQDNPPNFDDLIDFHQALSSLTSYPELLRALGLVFDFDLPPDFVAETSLASPGRLAIVDVPGQQWAIPTAAPPSVAPLETAYLYTEFGTAGTPFRLFTTAPRILGGGQNHLEVFGLLNLDPGRFGVAQVDVDSGMHKNTRLADSWTSDSEPLPPDRPDVFDETTTLPSLRSGGLSLFADGAALKLLLAFQENKQFNSSLEGGTTYKRPLFAEDLVQGFRIDIWDSLTGTWHSLHRRNADYQIEAQTFSAEDVEGFTQLAAAQPSPDPNNPAQPNDLYLNESAARWMGWSLSVPFPGKALSRDPDPAKALDEDPNHPPNEPATPFKMTTRFSRVAGSLPSLRFGRRYRLRVRPVDLCGGSMASEDALAHLLSLLMGLTRDPEGFPYLRYEPVAAPLVVARTPEALTSPGSKLQRLVMRTWNDDLSKDGDPADLTGSDRFIAPSGIGVDIGERMSMFDDANGKLVTSPAMYNLIAARDAGKLTHVDLEVAGQVQSVPLETGETIDALPYLPDVLGRGAALRDLPGSPEFSLATGQPGPGPVASLPYQPLATANPRPGSAALISFSPLPAGQSDWQNLLPFRLALADGNQPPDWDPAGRVLTVHMPKGLHAVVPLSSYLLGDDLKLMGIWQWLREFIDRVTVQFPAQPTADPELDEERIAHLLQRAVEGGHWMITPPRILHLVHALQQPLGMPAFTAVELQHEPYGSKYDEKINADPQVLQTAPEADPTAEGELVPITAWRKPGSEDASLIGGLKIHAASTAQVDLMAEWDDPYDDVTQPRLEGEAYIKKNTAQADEIPVSRLTDGFITTGQGTANYRLLAYYDADQDLLAFGRAGDRLGHLQSGVSLYADTAPRHHFNDTRRHRVRYTPKATSRYREYFPQDQDLDFTRLGPETLVDVPASARPAAPLIDYVIPTFGWQRQSETNLKRSVRFGGGLRVYMERPWFSSGEGELLGVLLYDYINGSQVDREAWKAYVTQWGADPAWQAPGVPFLPEIYSFPNALAHEASLTLPGRAPGRVRVVGFPAQFDYESQRWFADLTIDTQSLAYTPFIRLALARYQPHALPDAKLSTVMLADYAQLTPDRSAVLTADPYHPRRLRLTVSGPAPSGPAPVITGAKPTVPVTTPTLVTVTLQQRSHLVNNELDWEDAPPTAGTVTSQPQAGMPALVRWTGSIEFPGIVEPGELRVLVREYEYLPANYTINERKGRQIHREQPKRLIYAETFAIDQNLIGGPAGDTGTVLPM